MAANIDPRVEKLTHEFREKYQRLRDEIGKAIVGHGEIVDGVLTCLFAGGHVLLEGVPGLGKTYLIKTLSQALSLNFSRIQFTPDLMPADIIGTNIVMDDPTTGRREFRFQHGPIFAQIVLADEINRATPKTQSALLEAMQEHGVTSGGTRYKLAEPFFVMATQNPIEQEGTYPLPEAQLDRFFYKLVVQYSGREELKTILDRTTTGFQPKIEPVMSGEEIIAAQKLVQRVVMAPHVQDYVVRLVMATHTNGEFATDMTNKYVRWGSSPRGAQALTLASKVHALLDGRFNVSFADVQKAALPALRHRILLNFEGEAENLSTDDIIEDMLVKTPTLSEAAA
ncbi:MAG TPA: MoxR family ATPase [Phycisphaerae bacterium]|nr:MoxR family ATPase [Phycisphaerae bacterium]HOJ73256.1 MoxR family ATPase [Phycisphaerae bacterium]HOM51178.1 MoxR family ATPase [Phycisphaerae bacterium]HON66711.1 MoxR family ATPase [Phycisphaerae bacterium]HOQ85286.1 MoxR family ATPase [Phycisphaerae bacterium]